MRRAIVVGIGGDGSGARAAAVAATLAGPLGVPIVLVFGYETTPLGPRGGPLEAQIAAVGNQALEEVRNQLATTHPNLEVELRLLPRRPVDAILEEAEQSDALLVAVGHGRRSPLRGAVLGSVAYHVVHRCPRPVLVVPDSPEPATPAATPPSST